ncbi:2',3'-cyclic-nucleotide 3'-phosphodiesterase [Mycena galericulata]|nr:2',3'-cyclic-nucleotide 3'-phosphodiesterase [Mycena galericulata]
MNGLGLTLWLVPSQVDTARLRTIMDIRPSTDLLEASYPRFQPHITLASLSDDPPPSSDTIRSILSSIPQGKRPLSITFDAVEVGDHFFRSVYIAVHPSDDLLDLHRDVHAKLGITNPKTPKYPHISLCYISDDDAKVGERTNYFHQLQASGRIRQVGNSVSLNCRDRDGEDDWLSGFESPEIWIARCEGPVETWTVQTKISLS